MISWEHFRFLALLIPTWLVLGAVAATLVVPAKSASGSSVEASVAQATVATCRDSANIAAQQRKGEFVVATQRHDARQQDLAER